MRKEVDVNQGMMGKEDRKFVNKGVLLHGPAAVYAIRNLLHQMFMLVGVLHAKVKNGGSIVKQEDII